MKKILPLDIELKGSCTGVTAKQILRTEEKALFRRSDDCWECFLIKVTKEKSYKDGEWVPTGNTKEVYPNDNAFGVSAWCGKEEKIRKIYEGLPEKRNTDSAIDVSRFIRRSPRSKGIVPPEENNVPNLKQSMNINF